MKPVHNILEKVREINLRYSEPKIPLTRATKVILMALRLYLLTLVGLLVFALVTSLR